MEFYQHLYHQHLLNPYINAPITPQGSGIAERDPAQAERFPQWTHEETKELLTMRGQLDQSFVETKRNKQLWEVISAGLQRKGFHRTPDQCKSKWKNLVTRFKGSATMEGEDANRQFPFSVEMRKICSDRLGRQQTANHKVKGEGREVQVPAEELKEETTEAEEDEKVPEGSCRKKRRTEIRKKMSATEEEVESALREFARRHLEMEMRRLEEAEAREAERRAEEEEWRKEMECLQMQRIEMERKWREEEEARRARAEARAERRHAVFMALLDKLAEKCL